METRLDAPPHGKAVLFVAHPGHELRVYHWLEKAKPTVLVLTDGSGRSGVSRLQSTTRLVTAAGGRIGPLYGRFTDRELYGAIVGGRSQLFCDLVDELVTVLREEGAQEVAGDAVEGFNPGHDVCRLMLNAAVAILAGARRPAQRNVDFTLEALPGDCPAELRRDATWIRLGDAALARKLAAAYSYEGMEDEIRAIVARHGTEPFAVECLRPVQYGLDVSALVGETPFYEAHGQRRVREGNYEAVIRFREHVAPLARHLERHVAVRTAPRPPERWPLPPSVRSSPPRASIAAPPPFPIVCGVARSGTTLLRLMLDAHSQLAVPPETGFLKAAGEAHGAGTVLGRDALLALISGFETWPDFVVSRESLRQALEGIEPFSTAEGVRAFYRLYASRFGKPRGGDKTPMYAQYLLEIQELLPEAHFIHIIRDGRDVALSLREVWFSPGDDMEALARHWVEAVTRTRALAPRCRHYREVRYEDLVRDTRLVLQGICDFVDLPYDPAMERYHLRARARLAEVQERRQADGTLLVSRETRLWQQRYSSREPDASRVGRWRREMTAAEREAFEGVAGELLVREGYELSCDPRPA